MADSVQMTYGGYNFAAEAGPIPFLTINVSTLKSEDGATVLGTIYNATLEGTLTPLPTGQWGYSNLDYMQDKLISGFNTDGQLFEVTCNSTVLISQYPRINNIRLDKSQDNWHITTPYTIELEWDGAPTSGDIFVNDIRETWQIEVTDELARYDWTLNSTGDYNGDITRVTHTLSAKGVSHYSGGGLIRDAWQHAQAWVESRPGFDENTGFNHMRVTNIDELAGTYSVTESWVLLNNFLHGSALEDFTATVRYNIDSDLTTVDINGSIEGVEIRDYLPNYTVQQKKYYNASGYWNNVSPKLYNRAIRAAGVGSSVNPIALDYVVGHNPTKGVINYSYTFDTRPCHFITGAIAEEINITDTLPTDVFASIIIPGRGAGPLLQDIGTTTSHSRTVDINALISRPTGCSTITGVFANKPTAQVEAILCQLYNQLSLTAGQIFVSQNNESYNPKTGRYSRNITWTIGYCSGELIDTSVC